MVLETPEERIKLLKQGITGDRIEKMYIELNNIRVVRIPVLEVQEDYSVHHLKTIA